MDIQSEILNAVQIMIEKTMDKRDICRTIPSVVQEVSDNKYRVKINGSDFWVKSGANLTLSKGKAVWVHLPNSNIQNAFIIGYR